ncbi:DNA helicase IV [Rhodococcus sp. 27YEA15]
MRTHTYEDELRSEQSYVDELYVRLAAERARVRAEYDEALRSPVDTQNGGALVERDAKVRALFKEAKRLEVADNGLCFGRLDAVTGERTYVGRIGLLDKDNDYEPVLLDWRAPASRAFYVATGASPENMRRRRQFHTRGHAVVDFTDELLGRPDAIARGSRGDSALLAAIDAPRGDGMRDIVATIQSEQDDIVRLDHQGVLVVEGGPGTGKTVVALHRVAYLLYTQREQMERHGVLVVGPNPAFLDHISQVLPSLGESDVVFTSTGDLVPGLHATAEDEPETAQAKGSLQILDVLVAAVADRQRIPEEAIPIDLSGVTVHLDAETADWGREEARASGLPHNAARAVFVDILTWALTERAIIRIGKGWLTRSDRQAWEQMRDGLRLELIENRTFSAALDELWPTLTPEILLAQLYTSSERLSSAGAGRDLYRANGAAWTVSDVPLLDELTDMLGQDTVEDKAAEQKRRSEIDYAADVLDTLISHEDLMDDEDHLIAQDMLYGEDLADRFVERDTRALAERAATDRNWTYRHVVVDEAQELSAMDWRVLMRRCPSRSFTVVGDLAQRRSAAGALSWDAMLDPYVPDRWVYRSLSVNYRTPSEIMAVATAVLAEFAPDVTPPESVRSCGIRPWSLRVDESELPSAIESFVRAESAREGNSIVLGPAGSAGTTAVSETKGLEFDAVLVVEPERIVAESPRGAAQLYVALTRSTQRLGILHVSALPRELAELTARDQSCGTCDNSMTTP